MATGGKKDNEKIVLPAHDPRVVEEWRVAIAHDEDIDDGKDAGAFVRYYEDFIKKNPTFVTTYPDAAAQYDDLYTRALWLSFSFLSRKEGLAVFEKCLWAAVRMPTIDVWEKVRMWLVQIPLQLRDETKAKLLTVLQQSGTIVTATPLVDGAKEVPGTMGAWVKDYLGHVGTEKTDKLVRSEFLFSNKTFSRLRKEEQEVLRKFFMLVDKLLLSSETAEGFEEDRVGILVDEVIDVEGGEEKKLAPEQEALLKRIQKAMSGSSPEQLRARLMGSEEERSRMRVAEDSLEKSLGADVAKIRDALFVTASKTSSGSSAEPVALVRLLIKSGGFAGLLREDPRFAELLRKRYEAGGARGKADDLKVYPTSAQHLAAFAQMLLVEQLGLSPSDAARHLIQWMNLLSRAGVKIFVEPPAYFSEEADAFQFAQPLPAVRS
jgi:hypothetical protein